MLCDLYVSEKCNCAVVVESTGRSGVIFSKEKQKEFGTLTHQAILEIHRNTIPIVFDDYRTILNNIKRDGYHIHKL